MVDCDPPDAQLSSHFGHVPSEYTWGNPMFLASVLGLSFNCPRKQEPKSQTQTTAKTNPTSPHRRLPRPRHWSGGHWGIQQDSISAPTGLTSRAEQLCRTHPGEPGPTYRGCGDAVGVQVRQAAGGSGSLIFQVTSRPWWGSRSGFPPRFHCSQTNDFDIAP